jgi:predicted component of type VI protein secretion system
MTTPWGCEHPCACNCVEDLARERDAQVDARTIVEVNLADAERKLAEALEELNICRAHNRMMEQSHAAHRDALERELAEAVEVVKGLLTEWDRLTQYGSPMAKAANPRVSAARAFIQKKRNNDVATVSEAD